MAATKKLEKKSEVKNDLFRTKEKQDASKTKSINNETETTQEIKSKRVKPKLTGKTKFWYIFLCIITLSIFYFYIQNKIKKASSSNQTKKVEQVEKEEKESNNKVKPLTTSKKTTENKKVETKKEVTKEKVSNIENLKVSDKVSFDISKLIDYLGGTSNIDSVDASLSSLKVMVKDKTKIKQEEIKKLGAKGLIISNLKISILFGDNSATIKKLIEQELSK